MKTWIVKKNFVYWDQQGDQSSIKNGSDRGKENFLPSIPFLSSLVFFPTSRQQDTGQPDLETVKF